MAENETLQDVALMAGAVFTPTVPVSEESLFAGRMPEIRRVVDVVNQRGKHAIIYGERGVGKTSLANIISNKFSSSRRPVVAPRVNCDGTDTFPSLWKKVFSQVDLLKKKRQAPGFQLTVFEETVKAADVVGDNVTPDQVRRLLTLIGEDQLIILIFDEFDRLDIEARRAMADTIKALSDHDVEATIVLVGVGDSVDALIAEHRSVERALDQIQMPRMHRDEVFELLRNGADRLGMAFDHQAKLRIALLSQGLPPYAHLLALHAVRTALDSGTKTVEVEHVSAAISKATIGSQRSLLSDLQKATTSPQKRKHLYAEVLLACAMAKTDEYGFFYAADVRGPLSNILNRVLGIPNFAQHLSDFCQPDKGPVLQKVGIKHKFRYRFIDPYLQPLVIMKGIVDKRITEEQLELADKVTGENTMTPAL